jgi:hypothetical protein
MAENNKALATSSSQASESKNSQKALTLFSDQLVGVLNQFSKFAEKAPSIVLISIGLASIAYGFLAKNPIGDTAMVSLKPSEFITVFIVGAFLIVLGSLVRVYQLKTQSDLANRLLDISEAKREAAEKTEDKATDVAKEITKKQW